MCVDVTYDNGAQEQFYVRDDDEARRRMKFNLEMLYRNTRMSIPLFLPVDTEEGMVLISVARIRTVEVTMEGEPF